MKITAVFLVAASFVLKGSAIALTIDHFYPSARMLHGVNIYRRDVPDNATYDNMINATISGTGQQLIQNDIQNLTANTLSILSTFNSIAAQLAVIDSQNLTTTNFSGSWAALQKQFITHLADSRDAASNVSAFCQELSVTIAPFVLNVIPGLPPVPPSNATDILNAVIAEAGDLKSTALLVSQDFGTLVTNMVIFTSTFAAFADSEQSINIQLIQLRADLNSLNMDIAILQTEISAIAIALGLTIFGTPTLAVIFPEFAPFILAAGAIVTAGEFAALGVLESQLSAKQQDVSNDQAEIALLTRELQEIAQANSTLATISNNTIPTVALQLNSFEAIWNAVDADLVRLIAFVNTAKNIPYIAYEVLTMDVSPLYSGLSAAMLAYASGIQNGGATSNVVKLPATIADHVPLTQTAAKIQVIMAKAGLATS